MPKKISGFGAEPQLSQRLEVNSIIQVSK